MPVSGGRICYPEKVSRYGIIGEHGVAECRTITTLNRSETG